MKNFKKGFTLIETLAVVAIIAVASTLFIINYPKFYRNFKFQEYSLQIESITKFAKIRAMELSKNIGLCVNTAGKEILITDMGTQRTGICSGNTLSTVKIEENFISLDGSSTGFDPRGFALRPGRVCISDGEKYFKVCISRWGAIRTEAGRGTCGPC